VFLSSFSPFSIQLHRRGTLSCCSGHLSLKCYGTVRRTSSAQSNVLHTRTPHVTAAAARRQSELTRTRAKSDKNNHKTNSAVSKGRTNLHAAPAPSLRDLDPPSKRITRNQPTANVKLHQSPRKIQKIYINSSPGRRPRLSSKCNPFYGSS